MKLKIVAIGRLRSGPEADLIADYQTRFTRTGRPLSLGPLEITELEAKKGGQTEETRLLLKATEAADLVVALDERGTTLTSPEFAQKLAKWRDSGTREAAFILGGADGLSDEVRNRAPFKLSFGRMVWPHMLARVMLTEQLYRAASILSGSPYHRE